ncbi:MAG: disulfide bond formation protein B [Gammaproteobacteria bacterium]
MQNAIASSHFPSQRLINTLGFVACAGLLAYAYYLQFYQDLEPCPLCIFQRVAMFALGVVFLLAALHNPRGGGAKVYGALIFLTAAVGAVIAARHVWIQHLPTDQIPECGPSLDYLLQSIPFLQVIKTVLRGSGECAEIGWTFLGLSIPEWTLIAFITMGLVGMIRNWRPT